MHEKITEIKYSMLHNYYFIQRSFLKAYIGDRWHFYILLHLFTKTLGQWFDILSMVMWYVMTTRCLKHGIKVSYNEINVSG